MLEREGLHESGSRWMVGRWIRGVEANSIDGGWRGRSA